MTAYYNEIDPYCAQWLRNLIAAGLIPAGDVDERLIEEVTADDVRPYTQAHFFAGIGGWAYAARLAGWPDDRPLWTGSCPCQPFSNAGKRLAYDDPRNLWPDFARLIQDCRPPAVAGEQVASKAGRLWLAGVRADLEALGYGVGAADLCAAGIGAPHIRQRLWWVADTYGQCEGSLTGVREGQGAERAGTRSDRWVADAECGAAERHGHEMAGATRGMQEAPRQQRVRDNAGDGGAVGRLGHTEHARLEGHAGHGDGSGEPGREPADAAGSVAEAGGDCGVADDDSDGRSGRPQRDEWPTAGEPAPRGHDAAGCSDLHGGRAGGWIPCADGKARRIEPGIVPLVDGFPGRVDQVRAYGNSIVPQVAAEFLTAYIETTETP